MSKSPTPITDAAFSRLDDDDSLDNYERFEGMTRHAEVLECSQAKMKQAIENVLAASEDGGDMDDIDWNELREAIKSTTA